MTKVSKGFDGFTLMRTVADLTNDIVGGMR